MPHRIAPQLTAATPEQHREQIELAARVLEYFIVDPDELDAHGLRDLVEHEDFKDYGENYLRDLVHSMTKIGLIARFPHLRTRAALYYTTPLGRAMIKTLREE